MELDVRTLCLARLGALLADGGGRRRTAAEVVTTLGAMQAQDYASALWAVGLRSGETEEQVEAAIERREIVRTWPMRGTLHFVPAADARWMVALLAPRVIASARGRARQLELDGETFAAARRVLVCALQGGRRLTRPDAYAALAAGSVEPAGQRGMHILSRLAMEGVLCLGPRKGRQPTFVLLDEWVPDSRDLPPEEGLARLADRYFRSHGPATVEDFAWWTGSPITQARSALASIDTTMVGTWRARPLYRAGASPATTRNVDLLAAFDEYVLGYRDRSACLASAVDHYVTKNGSFLATVVIDGAVVGVWRRQRTNSGATLTCRQFRSFTAAEHRSVEAAAARYAEFARTPVRVAWTDASTRRTG